MMELFFAFKFLDHLIFEVGFGEMSKVFFWTKYSTMSNYGNSINPSWLIAVGIKFSFKDSFHFL